MRFTETSVSGAFVIAPQPRRDARGFFARTFCVDEFQDHGLDPTIAQSSIAFNQSAGTLRGLHYQAPPHGERKTLRCLTGSLFAVAVDLRPDSPTFQAHLAVELDSRDRRALYVPRGCATGYQTLEDDTELVYDISNPYAPGYERGIHHRDPALGIDWPLPVSSISDRDAALPLLEMVPALR